MVKAVAMVKVVEAAEIAAKEYTWLAARRAPGIELTRISRIRRARVVITWLRSAIYRAKQQHGKQNLPLHDANLPYPVLSVFTATIHSPRHDGASPDGMFCVTGGEFCVSGAAVMVFDRLSAAAASTQ
ncbi:hypothetical protein [Paraburkholderia sp. BR14374]|uniref:hypothetical protein n=1 Tax=Paraburkholderia sp. BR14374 TaxID=3237007 RepID=UPI0034D01439